MKKIFYTLTLLVILMAGTSSSTPEVTLQPNPPNSGWYVDKVIYTIMRDNWNGRDILSDVRVYWMESGQTCWQNHDMFHNYLIWQRVIEGWQNVQCIPQLCLQRSTLPDESTFTMVIVVWYTDGLRSYSEREEVNHITLPATVVYCIWLPINLPQ